MTDNKMPFLLGNQIGCGCPSTDGNNSYMQYFGAQTKKKLDTPINKTSANGMTVTYELEVSL